MKNDDKSTQLAKVLWYYNLIPDVHHLHQKIICPFHSDANPSMLVDFKEGSWYCFGCNKSGDAMRFVQLMENKYNGLNDFAATKKYYQILKSDKVSNIHISAQDKKNMPSSKQLYDEAYDFYHGLKLPDWEHDEEEEVLDARGYMEQRGFEPHTLQQVKAKVTYQYSYGLIFPIMDNNKFRGWVCRTMRKEIEQKRKYLYNAGFSRATTLCGQYGSEDYVFVVEGYMDRLRFVQNGVTNVVALLGWKMSTQQEAKLKSAGIKYIISALDNDECGRKGTTYLKTIAGFEVVRWSYIKGIKDPGEMSAKQFQKMFQHTMSKFEVIRLSNKNKTKRR